MIKHGLLAEFINWHCKEISQNLSFYDPFGGRPWQNPVNKTVAQRIDNLDPCPLKIAQQKCIQGYFGSGHLVAQISKESDFRVRIYASDKNSDARRDLDKSGLNLIEKHWFVHDDGYSILNCEFPDDENTLILIDPFYDLENINACVLEKAIHKVAECSISLGLFVLYTDSGIEQWNNFRKMQTSLISQYSVTPDAAVCC